MPTSTAPAPVVTPTIAPTPAPSLWPERYTDPLKICTQQRREITSPDVEP